MKTKYEHRKAAKSILSFFDRTPEEIALAEWNLYPYPIKWHFVQFWNSRGIDWQTRLGNQQSNQS